MKLMIDTNIIVSPLVDDEFAEESILFLKKARRRGFALLISPIILSELYTWVYLDPDPKKRERELNDFLAAAHISIIMALPREIVKRAGELHAEYVKRGGKRKRISPDFIIGAYAEHFADIFVTWNPEDFKLKIPVKTPKEILREL